MSGPPPKLAVTLDDGRVETWTVARADRAEDGVWRLALVDPAGAVHRVEAISGERGDIWTAIDGVVRVVASVGQKVAAGDVLVLLEAMKMELAIRAPHDGTVARIACEAGAIVQPGVPLVELS